MTAHGDITTYNIWYGKQPADLRKMIRKFSRIYLEEICKGDLTHDHLDEMTQTIFRSDLRRAGERTNN